MHKRNKICTKWYNIKYQSNKKPERKKGKCSSNEIKKIDKERERERKWDRESFLYV